MLNTHKTSGLVVSENVFNILFNMEFEYECSIMVGTFNNCRENGLALDVYVTNQHASKDIKVWVCQHRSSDCIMVVVGKSEGLYNMFSEEAYNNAKYFNYDEYYLAAKYIKDRLDNLVLE